MVVFSVGFNSGFKLKINFNTIAMIFIKPKPRLGVGFMADQQMNNILLTPNRPSWPDIIIINKLIIRKLIANGHSYIWNNHSGKWKRPWFSFILRSTPWGGHVAKTFIVIIIISIKKHTECYNHSGIGRPESLGLHVVVETVGVHLKQFVSLAYPVPSSVISRVYLGIWAFK